MRRLAWMGGLGLLAFSVACGSEGGPGGGPGTDGNKLPAPELHWSHNLGPSARIVQSSIGGGGKGGHGGGGAGGTQGNEGGSGGKDKDPKPPKDHKKGALEISKDVCHDSHGYEGERDCDVNSTEEFKVEVRLVGSHQVVAEFEIKDGQTKRLELPPGEYEVKEVHVPSGFRPEKREQKVEVKAGKTAEVEIVNLLVEGRLRLEKDVCAIVRERHNRDHGYNSWGRDHNEGRDEDLDCRSFVDNTEFEFAAFSPDYPDMEFVFRMGENSPKTLVLPAGTWKIAEVAKPGYMPIDTMPIVFEVNEHTDKKFTFRNLRQQWNVELEKKYCREVRRDYSPRGLDGADFIYSLDEIDEANLEAEDEVVEGEAFSSSSGRRYLDCRSITVPDFAAPMKLFKKDDDDRHDDRYDDRYGNRHGNRHDLTLVAEFGARQGTTFLNLEPGTYILEEDCYGLPEAFRCEGRNRKEFKVREVRNCGGASCADVARIEFRNIVRFREITLRKQIENCDSYACRDADFEIVLEREGDTPLVIWKDGHGRYERLRLNEGFVGTVSVKDPLWLTLPRGDYDATELPKEGFITEDPYGDTIEDILDCRHPTFENLFDPRQCTDNIDNDWNGKEDCEERICREEMAVCKKKY